MTKSYKKKTKSDANDSRTAEIAIQYMDGLGRPIQNVAIQATPDGKDIIEHIEYIPYDAANRESKSYLPFTVGSGNKGKFTDSPGTAQSTYYNSPPSGVAGDSKPYSIVKFENSPLNRTMEIQPTGNNWGNKRNVQSYTYNKADISNAVPIKKEFPIKRFVYKGDFSDAETNLAAIRYDNNYPDLSLTSEIYTDAELHQVREYKDFEGKTILKRQFFENDIWHDTYYVYDDLNQLRAIIPPLLSKETFSATENIAAAKLNELASLNNYDAKGRIIQQKNPGAAVIYSIYDYWGRKAFTQDGNQRARNAWSFVKYDMLNRIVLSGEVAYTGDRPTLQSAVNNVTAEDKRAVSRSGGNDYTINNNPNAVSIGMAQALTVHYYDSYGFKRPSESTPAGYATVPAGLPTGSRSLVLGTTNNWVRSVVYYDSEYRVLQTIRDLYDIPGSTSPTEWATTEYDPNYFSKVNKDIVQHKGLTNSTTNTVENSYCYDHTLRVKKTSLKLNSLAEITLNSFVYNELGQVIKKSIGKKNGGNYVDETTVQYHINGSPTRLTSAKFSQEIYYEKRKNNTDGYYSGNISEMYWQNGSSGMKNYAYQYDNLSRLTSATSSNFQYEEKGITYDANGNIKTMRRTWNGTPAIDNLAYTYANNNLSNQLANVNDQSNNNTGYKGGTNAYSYDANGNIRTDASRGITSPIVYNLLDMVQAVSVNAKNLRYTYSADGEKLKYEEVGTSTKTVYAGAAEYGNTGYLTRLETAEGYITYNSSNSTFSFFYNLTDYLGNVRIVLDENGNAVQSNEYLPFGMVVSSDASPYSGKNKYFYQGKEMQAEQLWYDFHARMYDPALGRFNGVDPQGQFASPYIGMGNNPVVGVDPNGEWVMQAIGAGVGLVTGYLNARKSGASFGQAVGQAVVGGVIGFATGSMGSAISGSIATSIGGTAGSYIGGAIGGAIGGGAGGGFSAAYAGGDFFQGAKWGAIAGAVGGVVNQAMVDIDGATTRAEYDNGLTASTGSGPGRIMTTASAQSLKWQNIKEAIHIGLDVAGQVPGVGEIADGANALFYLGEGDFGNAAISGGSMIPIIGNAASGTRLGYKAMKMAEKYGSIMKVTSKKADYLFPDRSDAMNWARKQLGHNTQKLFDANGKLIGWSSSKGSVYWGHGDWGKGVGSSTFPHLNYNIGGKKGHLFLQNKIVNKGMWNDFMKYFGN